MKKLFLSVLFAVSFIYIFQGTSKSEIAVTCNFTVNGGALSSGYKFWKSPPIPSNYYSVTLQISNFSGNWALYIANSGGNIAPVATNQSGTSFTFYFSVPTSNPSYPDGGGYRFRVTAQGQPTNIWCESNQFYISNLPTLSMTLNTTPPLIIGSNAQVSWSVSGGVPGLPYGGWTGNIRLQWYQNSNPLTNLVQVPVSNNSYTFTVPSSISGGNVPGTNFRIAGTPADAGTSIPSGYVFAFTNYFDIAATPPSIPNLTYPSNGSTINDLTPDLSWTANNAVSFWGQVSTSPSFSTLAAENTNIGSFNWTPTLSQYTTYYWRIRSRGSGGTLSDWSSVWSFTVANTPTLISPSNGSTVTSSAFTFQWSDCNALYYELLVDNNSGFGSPEISKNHLIQLRNYTGTSFQISGNWLEQNLYYWKVYAVYSGGLRVQSAVGSFTYSPTPTSSPTWIPIYRAYKSSDVDHFYCTNDIHLVQAIQNGYDFEKVDGYLSLTPFVTSNLKCVFRFYDSTQMSHIYTTNSVTKDSLISASTGNKYEGISGYAYGTAEPGMVRLYYTHLYNSNPALIDHFYTISDVEKNNSLANGYTDRGFIAYVSPIGNEASEAWMEMQPEIGYGINPQNGNVGIYNKTSFNIPGAKTSLSFMHVYNSFTTRLFSQVNSVGAGWSHSYMATLSTLGNKIYVMWPGGGVHIYNASDLKPDTKGVYDVLVKVSSSRYKITKKDQFVYTFDMLNASVDSTAFLKTIADRNGNTITINYDSQRRITSVVSPEGRSLVFSYYTIAGKTNLIYQISGPVSRTIRFEYDNDNNLIRFTDAKGQLTQYQYDPNARFDHLMTKVIFPKGNSTNIQNTYVSRKVVTQKRGNTGQSINIAYGSMSSTITDETNRQTTIFYSSPKAGLITSLTSGSVRDSFEYNDNQNPVKPSKIIDGRGYVTSISYDSKGNPLQVTKPGNILHRFLYNSFNDITQYTDPRNKVTNYGYNATGNLISIHTPRGLTQISYNANGTISTITDPLSRVTSYGYNGYGNVQTVTDNMGHQTSFVYDGASRVISSTDPNQRTTAYTYDNNDLLTRITRPGTNIVNYVYDANDNLYNVTDAKGQTTTFNHNYKDLLENIFNPLSNQTSFDYYENGLLQYKTKPDNQSVTYSYDPSNRLQSMSGAISGNFVYDNNNNVVSASNQNGAITYAYDGLNRITSTTDYYNNTVSYGYDASSNIVSITYPGNKVVLYTYYDDNLLQTVRDWQGNTTTYTYRNDGSIQEITYPNGTKKTYTYDAAGRITGIANKRSDGTVICQYAYTLDNVGNHIAVTQTEPLDLPPILAASSSYTYNSANRLTSDGISTYSYDFNGNLIQRVGTDTVNFGYDAENRLSNMSGSFEAGYSYDVYGNRRYSNIGGTVKKYVLDVNTSLPRVLLETDNSGNVLNYYVYGLELISRIKTDNSTSNFHSDYRGSVVAMSNSAQQITHKYKYGPFGELLSKAEADSNPFKYVGAYGVMDEGNGLYFMRARFYDPKIGRFVSEDPLWGLNLYAYGRNNPLGNIDPDGNFDFPSTDKLKQELVNIGDQLRDEALRIGSKIVVKSIQGYQFFFNRGNLIAVTRNVKGRFVKVETVFKPSVVIKNLISGYVTKKVMDQYYIMVYGTAGEDAPFPLSLIDNLTGIPIFGNVQSAQ